MTSEQIGSVENTPANLNQEAVQAIVSYYDIAGSKTLSKLQKKDKTRNFSKMARADNPSNQLYPDFKFSGHISLEELQEQEQRLNVKVKQTHKEMIKNPEKESQFKEILQKLIAVRAEISVQQVRMKLQKKFPNELKNVSLTALENLIRRTLYPEHPQFLVHKKIDLQSPATNLVGESENVSRVKLTNKSAMEIHEANSNGNSKNNFEDRIVSFVLKLKIRNDYQLLKKVGKDQREEIFNRLDANLHKLIDKQEKDTSYVYDSKALKELKITEDSIKKALVSNVEKGEQFSQNIKNLKGNELSKKKTELNEGIKNVLKINNNNQNTLEFNALLRTLLEVREETNKRKLLKKLQKELKIVMKKIYKGKSEKWQELKEVCQSGALLQVLEAQQAKNNLSHDSSILVHEKVNEGPAKIPTQKKVG